MDHTLADVRPLVLARSLELIARSGAFDILFTPGDHSQFRGEQEHECCALILRALAWRDSRYGEALG